MAARKKIPIDVITKVVHEAGYRCANPACRTIITIDIHHIEYVSAGGSNEPDNLLPLCPTCHALHHKHFISNESIRTWKMLLLSLNHAFDRQAVDILLLLATQPHLDVNGEGVLQCAGLIASGLVLTDVRQVSQTRYVALTPKGQQFVEAWKAGNQRLAIASDAQLPGLPA